MATVVAIDGPAASGKSTVARRVAKELGYLYVDSGAFYRAVAWTALGFRIDGRDRGTIQRMLESMQVQLFVAEGCVRFTVDGVDPQPFLRTKEVTELASRLAVLSEVRARINCWLRFCRTFGDLVVEGRDIGTVVFPNAAFKFYLDATPEERARRRYAEKTEGAAGASLVDVEAALRHRDDTDSSRDVAPLSVASDAIVVDTTNLDVEGVVAILLAKIQGKRSGEKNG